MGCRVNSREIYMCLFIMLLLMNLLPLSLQIIFQATIRSANATVAIDNISITKECEVVNISLSAIKPENKGKFCSSQCVFF